MAKLEMRYTRATRSSNLKCDDKHFDTDSLAAVALSSEFGAAIFRVKYGNDPTTYNQLRDQWRFHIKKRAVVDHWPEHINEGCVADEAMAYWLNDLCRPCGGKGKKKMEFVDVLSNDNCDFCLGTGKKPIECDPNIKRFVLDALTTLERLAIESAAVAMNKLSTEMDL